MSVISVVYVVGVIEKVMRLGVVGGLGYDVWWWRLAAEYVSVIMMWMMCWGLIGGLLMLCHVKLVGYWCQVVKVGGDGGGGENVVMCNLEV